VRPIPDGEELNGLLPGRAGAGRRAGEPTIPGADGRGGLALPGPPARAAGANGWPAGVIGGEDVSPGCGRPSGVIVDRSGLVGAIRAGVASLPGVTVRGVTGCVVTGWAVPGCGGPIRGLAGCAGPFGRGSVAAGPLGEAPVWDPPASEPDGHGAGAGAVGRSVIAPVVAVAMLEREPAPFPGAEVRRAVGALTCSAFAPSTRGMFSRSLRTTGGSIVDEAERTNSPISASLASTVLLS